jgi:hypothetical protein
VLLVQGEVQFDQLLVPALIPVRPLPQRFLMADGVVAMDQVADLLAPVPQRVALPGFGDDDHVEVGVFIGSPLRERAVNDHRAHRGVSFHPGRSSRPCVQQEWSWAFPSAGLAQVSFASYKRMMK